MKDILIKLANGEKVFNCMWNGEETECEILMINFETCQAFVRFKTPMKKTIRKEVESCWGMDRDDTLPMEDVVVDTSEEWISLPNHDNL